MYLRVLCCLAMTLLLVSCDDPSTLGPELANRYSLVYVNSEPLPTELSEGEILDHAQLELSNGNFQLTFRLLDQGMLRDSTITGDFGFGGDQLILEGGPGDGDLVLTLGEDNMLRGVDHMGRVLEFWPGPYTATR